MIWKEKQLDFIVKSSKMFVQMAELTVHQLYGVPITDPELIQRLSNAREKIKKEKALEMIKDIPVSCLQERLDNSEKIIKYLEGDV